MIAPGSLVVYVTPKRKRYIRRLNFDEIWHTHAGSIAPEQVAAAQYGEVIKTSMGMPVRLERPTLSDLLTGIRRKTQIIYPKDIAYICLKLGAGPGRTIVEAGCGSGALTLALSWFCGPGGRVVSHDERAEFAALARRNLDWADLGQNVDLHVADIATGFAIANADALFLDVREPWLFLAQAADALKPGAPLGFILPTTGQVSQLLAAMEEGPFDEIEVSELLLRPWKALADRLRPADRMVSHTGFLVFARLQPQCQEFDNYLPPGTRERKQIAARQEKAMQPDAANPEF